jgi:hypothetical protein
MRKQSPSKTEFAIHSLTTKSQPYTKRNVNDNTLNKLKQCGRLCITLSRLGIVEWFHYQQRPISLKFQRLRTGHNRLSAFIGKLDMEKDPLQKTLADYTPIKEFFLKITLPCAAPTI